MPAKAIGYERDAVLAVVMILDEGSPRLVLSVGPARVSMAGGHLSAVGRSPSGHVGGRKIRSSYVSS
jgi:hypothetical protein